MLRFFVALVMINFFLFAIAVIAFYYFIDSMKQMSMEIFGIIVIQLIDFLKEPLHLAVSLAFCIAMIVAHEIDLARKI